MTPAGWEAVIGLEVHVELATKTKMFSDTPIAAAAPNAGVGPVDLGLPGTLPVVNGRAVEYAIRLGLALDCTIADNCEFHRKNYFYPDMPKNYQISQYDVPLCERGHLDVEVGGAVRRVGITRVHMEEDTGKTSHLGVSGRIHGATGSLVDYNRAGVPLLECVSEPDLRTAEEAQAYLVELRAIVAALGISDAKLEEGSMRCDANVSVRRLRGENAQDSLGETSYGTRTETKNLNSVRSLGRAIVHEVARQIDVLDSGGKVVQETRHWDEARGVTSTLRRKETLEDYRYFPDPDLVRIAPDRAWVDELRAGLPELPAAIRRRIAADHALTTAEVAILQGGGLLGLLESAIEAGAAPADAAKWLANEVTAWGHEHQRDATQVLSGADLAELIALVADGTLSTKLAREVLLEVLDGAGSPRAVAEATGRVQLSDSGELEAVIDQVIAADAAAAQRVRDGNAKAIGALVGAVMKATQGKANPQLVNQLLRDRLS